MPAAPRVRAATAADLDELARMGTALAAVHRAFDPLRFMGPGGAEETGQMVAGYRWWFAKELANKRASFHVAVTARGRVIGYVYGRLEGKDWAELLDSHAALVDVFVEPRARGSGAGGELVRAFCAWADESGAPRVVLSTATQNAAAQALFAKLGFRRTMVEMTRERGEPGAAVSRPRPTARPRPPRGAGAPRGGPRARARAR
jgi:RimJ/RimL family protein N-acetyltransferase